MKNPNADYVNALIPVNECLTHFLESGMQSGVEQDDDPPKRDYVLPGGDLHNGIKTIESFYKSQYLPAPTPRNEWGRLVDGARDIEDARQWQTVAHETADVIQTWVLSQLRSAIGLLSADELVRLQDRHKNELAEAELNFRAQAKRLLHSYVGPGDNGRIAIIVSQKVGVGPTEFDRMEAGYRAKVIESVIALEEDLYATLSPGERSIMDIIGDDTMTANQIAEKAGKLQANSDLRRQLSNLKKRRFLGNDGRGYYRLLIQVT